MPGVEETLLAVDNVSKTFGSQRAVADVSLSVAAGEVRALVGPNGCGKSTLVKILAGYHHPDPGAEIYVAGEPLPVPHSPAIALAHGLRFIHQDLALVPSITVLENLALGRRYRTRVGHIDWRYERARARVALEPFGLAHRADDTTAVLSPGEQAIVAIARAFEELDSGRARVLLLDEPTTALPAHEVEVLFSALTSAADRGLGVIYISHRLDEIFTIASRVTIMRDARIITTLPVADLQRDDLVEHIVGKRMTRRTRASTGAVSSDGVVLRARDVRGKRLAGVSVALRRGEVVGATGLLGCGSDELAEMMFGRSTPTAGAFETADGEVLDAISPSTAVALGIGHVPADRFSEAAVPAMLVRENLTLPSVREFTSGGWLRIAKERSAVARSLVRNGLQPAESERVFGLLSGGNQQKVVIERWLRRELSLLVLVEPTRGIDVGTREAVYARIADAARDGMAVFVASSDWEELARLCHRVLVFRDGHVVAELQEGDLTVESIATEVFAGDPSPAVAVTRAGAAR